MTVEWMSTRNHSRNIRMSLPGGQVDSSSVHDASCDSNSHGAFSSTHSSTSSSTSNSGRRIAVPYGLTRATVSMPLLESESCLRVQSMYGCLPTTLTAVRLTMRMRGS